MQNKLKGWIAPNSITKDPKDKILILDPAGHVGLEEIYKEMREEDTGLRPETLTHVVTLYEPIVARFLMNGYYVNTGLFYAVPRFLGLIEKGCWNPEKNSIYVAFSQDKVLREEIAKTDIVIQGEKNDVMYILETEDRKTGLTDGEYELTVTTQYTKNKGVFLKSPRSVSVPVYVGEKKNEEDDRPVIE